jgi:cyclic pyranopterin phosphate synthase
MIASEFARHGLTSIKLTGGDPALWDPLVEAVRRLKQDVGFKDVHVISRHPRIGELAPALAGAKLDLLNMSIDTLKPALHHDITGINDLPQVIAAVRQCVAAGLPVKVNTVVMRGCNDTEIEHMAHEMAALGVRELKLLDVIQDLDDGEESFARRLKKIGATSVRDLYVPLSDIVDRLRPQVVAQQTVHQGGLGHPMLSLRLESGLTVTVKDHHAGAWYGSICKRCPHYPCHDALMALRVTADMRLQFCLLNGDVAVELRPLLARGGGALQSAIGNALAVYGAATFEQTQLTAPRRHIPLVESA